MRFWNMSFRDEYFQLTFWSNGFYLEILCKKYVWSSKAELLNSLALWCLHVGRLRKLNQRRMKIGWHRMLSSLTDVSVAFMQRALKISMNLTRDVNKTRDSRVLIFFLDPGKGISRLPWLKTNEREESVGHGGIWKCLNKIHYVNQNVHAERSLCRGRESWNENYFQCITAISVCEFLGISLCLCCEFPERESGTFANHIILHFSGFD